MVADVASKLDPKATTSLSLARYRGFSPKRSRAKYTLRRERSRIAKREHAIETVKQPIDTPPLVAVDQDFSIGRVR